MAESFGVPGASRADAAFLGWQQTPTGKSFAIYNIIAENHPLFQSTVTASTLRKLGLEIPPTADPRSTDSRAIETTEEKVTVHTLR